MHLQLLSSWMLSTDPKVGINLKSRCSSTTTPPMTTWGPFLWVSGWIPVWVICFTCSFDRSWNIYLQFHFFFSNTSIYEGVEVLDCEGARLEEAFTCYIFPLIPLTSPHHLPSTSNHTSILIFFIIYWLSLILFVEMSNLPLQVTWAQPLLENLLASKSSKSGSGLSFLISAQMYLNREQSEPSVKSAFCGRSWEKKMQVGGNKAGGERLSGQGKSSYKHKLLAWFNLHHIFNALCYI